MKWPLPRLFSLSPSFSTKKISYSRISSESHYSTDNVNNFKSLMRSLLLTPMQFYMSQVSLLRLWFFLGHLTNTCPSLRSRPITTSSVMPAWTLTTEIFLRHFVLISTKALKMAAKAGTQVQLFLLLSLPLTLTSKLWHLQTDQRISKRGLIKTWRLSFQENKSCVIVVLSTVIISFHIWIFLFAMNPLNQS